MLCFLRHNNAYNYIVDIFKQNSVFVFLKFLSLKIDSDILLAWYVVVVYPNKLHDFFILSFKPQIICIPCAFIDSSNFL